MALPVRRRAWTKVNPPYQTRIELPGREPLDGGGVVRDGDELHLEPGRLVEVRAEGRELAQELGGGLVGDGGDAELRRDRERRRNEEEHHSGEAASGVHGDLRDVTERARYWHDGRDRWWWGTVPVRGPPDAHHALAADERSGETTASATRSGPPTAMRRRSAPDARSTSVTSATTTSTRVRVRCT